MGKRKLTEAEKQELSALYVGFQSQYKGEFAQKNNAFMRELAKHPTLSDITAPVARGILVSLGTYEPTNPRQPKKKEVTKAEVLQRLNALTGEELVSASKMTIPDLLVLIDLLEEAAIVLSD